MQEQSNWLKEKSDRFTSVGWDAVEIDVFTVLILSLNLFYFRIKERTEELLSRLIPEQQP